METGLQIAGFVELTTHSHDTATAHMGNRETLERKLCFCEAQKKLKTKKNEKMRRPATKLTIQKVANFTLMQSSRACYFL